MNFCSNVVGLMNAFPRSLRAANFDFAISQNIDYKCRMIIQYIGRSRTSEIGGGQTPWFRGERFCWKLHENENWSAVASVAPPFGSVNILCSHLINIKSLCM